MSFENKLRQLLDKDQPTVGTHLGIASPIVTELVGLSGQFDYVEFAGEYYPYTDFDLANLARTAEMYGMSTMIKIDQSPRIYIAERAMGIAGVQNLLFADLRTIEDVQLCVDAVRCDPKGIGGARFGRVMTKLGSLPAWVKYCDDAIVAIMIEKKIAVEHLEELLSVEGVDMVQWGPADFTVSSGIPGQYTNPKVKTLTSVAATSASAWTHRSYHVGSRTREKQFGTLWQKYEEADRSRRLNLFLPFWFSTALCNRIPVSRFCEASRYDVDDGSTRLTIRLSIMVR